METISRSVTKRGFSDKAASFIAKAKRPSTCAVYNAKWKFLTDWCVRRQVDPLHPPLGKVADFLIFLFEEKKYSPSTIKGYRAAISNTLKFGGGGRGRPIGSDENRSEIIRHMELANPLSRSLTPKWDLSCVLWSLTKSHTNPWLQPLSSMLPSKRLFSYL